MTSTTMFDFNTVILLLGLAAMWGTMMWRVAALEKKMDKHNNLVERLTKIEERSKSNTHRINDLKDEVDFFKGGEKQ